MKLCGYIIEIYLERKDFKTASEKLRKAEQTAKQFGSNYVYALYYDMLSDYYDNLLSGSYDAVEPEEKQILQKLIDTINRTISCSRKTRNPEGRTLLAKNFLAKATILIRNSPNKKNKSTACLMKHRKLYRKKCPLMLRCAEYTIRSVHGISR